MVKVSYVGTSKKDRNPELQRRGLLAFGWEKVFEEQISSRKEERPELGAAMDYRRKGNELVVWKRDRETPISEVDEPTVVRHCTNLSRKTGG